MNWNTHKVILIGCHFVKKTYGTKTGTLIILLKNSWYINWNINLLLLDVIKGC